MRNITIPHIVSDLKALPLYIIVANWGMRTKQKLTTLSVSRAFFITQQQARDILHYICNEGAGHIKSERLTLFDAQKRKIKAIMIHEIASSAYNCHVYVKRDYHPPSLSSSPGSGNTGSPPGKISESNISKLRKWMCIRRAGDVPPEHYLDSACPQSRNQDM
ncbi:TPA: CaiF/GrlA family transcriptional regulator [Escherichia coli]|nr:CaiF/GrlA family transcriptional regulator [Escherichia coli]